MRFRLVPTDDAFFGLFDDSATNVADCARLLRDVLADPTVAAAHEQVGGVRAPRRRARPHHRQPA